MFWMFTFVYTISQHIAHVEKDSDKYLLAK